MTVCPDCGLDHHPEAIEAAAEVEAAEVIADGVEGAAQHEARADVEVAKVEAERDVEMARINAKVEAGWQEARVAELEGQVSGMREIIDRLTAPPPAPEPAPAPAVEPAGDEPPAPEDKPAPPVPPKKKSGWWG